MTGAPPGDRTAAHPTAPEWSEAAIAGLLEVSRCPVCAVGVVAGRRCPYCGADFAGEIGDELWRASRTAAEALRARQAVLDRVPRRPLDARAPLAVAAAGPVEPTRQPASVASVSAASPPASSATVQSVLAVAGAGLVAVAAVVFTFFNPDLTAPLPRALIVGAIAAAFLGGAAMLARRRLRFSAEAIGALGAIFVALTAAAALPLLPNAVNDWAFAAVTALLCGGGLALLGPRAGIRAWRWCGLVALALVPAMFGLGGASAIATTAGCLASAAAASALVALTERLSGPLTAERVTLTAAQIAMVLTALITVWGADAADGAPLAFLVSGTLFATAAVAVASVRHPAGGFWAAAAGATLVAAVTVLPAAAPLFPLSTWFAVFPVAAGLGLLLVGAVAPLHHRVPRGPFFTGAVAVVAAVAALPTMIAVLTIVSTLTRPADDVFLLPGDGADLTTGLAALALSVGTFAGLTGAAAGTSQASRRLGVVGAWYGILAFLTLLCLPSLELWTRIGLALLAAVGAGVIVATRLRDASTAARLPLIVGSHAAVVFATVLSWRDDGLTVWAGVAIVVSIAALAATVPRAARFLHVGAAFAYALVVLATALTRAGAEPVVVVCLTTCGAGVTAIAVTFARRIPVRYWHAVLAVTAVPFAIGVVQVIFERSGWTALSTAVIFCLALTLVGTTREGLSILVRALAAATLVPAIAVVTVCLGAQLLAASGSPVVLPVIALVVAAVLASADAITGSLRRRLDPAHARAAATAIEASALLTGAIAVILALARPAAGLATALLVLVILGVGFAAAALFSPRRYAWPLAGASFTGALWSGWGILGVAGPEPYLLPPALAAAVVGAVLTARGTRAVGLYTVGLTVAVVPVLLALAAGATTALPGELTAGASGTARASALMITAWALVAASVVVTRSARPWVRRLRVLRAPTLAVAVVAAAGAAVQGVRWGLGLDAPPTDPAIVAALSLGVVGAGAAALAARGLRRAAPEGAWAARTRWLGAPAVLILAVAAWPSIQREWPVIWTMWALQLAFLALMVLVAARTLRVATGLPPVWFLFAVSFATAVVAWSPRDLRVEWFSVPLGAFLLAAGALALRGAARPATSTDLGARTLESWPAGWSGSWALLGPGLVTLLSASVAATYTDPRTWRAILVMAIALVAILIGARLRLAAPFVLGIVVLPVENVLAFLVQIGRGIEAMPWWITLSVVGAVLLIIAVGYERRAGDDSGIAARLRDLA
ncbi:SCO7613 C-terminal domain-containing membrane protein [Microbacterium timonense]|uniref:SCO7613 C-terminal domain-containing membrane protein n=1 Tax=Microbacterium timonense TaxID=2086576 RepID=UPI000D0E75CD|nr:hypothetical protein [Microbacterium timonense]